MEQQYYESIQKRHPLIVCLTNTVTVNEVANIILSTGASPVMSESAAELPELLHKAQAALINIGTHSPEFMENALTACQCAFEQRIPVILDPAGAGATLQRTESARRLLETGAISVIRGNASELSALSGNKNFPTQGVDASSSAQISDATLEYFAPIVKSLARRYHCIAAMSGAIDLIASDQALWLCRNGISWMPRITGTGCALSALVAAFVAASPRDNACEATAHAFSLMGIAGEIAYAKCQTLHEGLASFRLRMLDALSLMDDSQLARHKRLTCQYQS